MLLSAFATAKRRNYKDVFSRFKSPVLLHRSDLKPFFLYYSLESRISWHYFFVLPINFPLSTNLVAFTGPFFDVSVSSYLTYSSIFSTSVIILIFTPDLVFQRFSAYYPKYSTLCWFQSSHINHFSSPTLCSITHCTY